MPPAPWPHRLMAKPLAFQAGKAGSKPAGVTEPGNDRLDWRRGVGKLGVPAGLIIQRSPVQIRPPLLSRPPGRIFSGSSIWQSARPLTEWFQVRVLVGERSTHGCAEQLECSSPCQGEDRGFESRHDREERNSPYSPVRRFLLRSSAWPSSARPRLEAHFRPHQTPKPQTARPTTTYARPMHQMVRFPAAHSQRGESRACSAAVARFPDTEEVGGSIPPSPTSSRNRIR
jgi:hypothetical protein